MSLSDEEREAQPSDDEIGRAIAGLIGIRLNYEAQGSLPPALELIDLASKVCIDYGAQRRRLDKARASLLASQEEAARLRGEVERLDGVLNGPENFNKRANDLIARAAELIRTHPKEEAIAKAAAEERLRAPPGANALAIADGITNWAVACGFLHDSGNIPIREAIAAALVRYGEQAALTATREAHRATAPAFEAMGIALRMIRDAVEELGPVGCVRSRDVGPPNPSQDAEDIIAGIQAIGLTAREGAIAECAKAALGHDADRPRIDAVANAYMVGRSDAAADVRVLGQRKPG